jgi:STE24 endopeptidase
MRSCVLPRIPLTWSATEEGAAGPEPSADVAGAGTSATPAAGVDARGHSAWIDDERQRLARQYARRRRVLSLVNLGIGAVVVLVPLFSGLGFALRDVLAGAAVWRPLPGWVPLQVAAYFGVLFGATFVLNLPLAYYGGFALRHRYQLSTQSFGGWVMDLLKGLALSVVFELLAVELVYLLLAALPDWWWLVAGGVMLLVTVVLAQLMPVLLLPIFYKVAPLEDEALARRILAQAQRAHTRVRGIYVMRMSAKMREANAMLAGLGRTRRILIGDTLLSEFTPEEIEVVMAHELGHHVHRDIPKGIALQTVVTLGGLFLVNIVLHAVVSAVHAYHGLADPATMPLLAAALGVFGLVTLPLTNGFSRLVESQADAYALETTRDAEAFISGMTRLANQNLAELDPPGWVEFLLYDHPSTGRRLAMGRRFAAGEGSQ